MQTNMEESKVQYESITNSLEKQFLKSIRLSLIIYSYHSNKGSGVYQISIGNNQHTNVYCQMTSVSGCYGGGWTLVMKIDGSSVRLYGGFVKNMQCLQMKALNVINCYYIIPNISSLQKSIIVLL